MFNDLANRFHAGLRDLRGQLLGRISAVVTPQLSKEEQAARDAERRKFLAEQAARMETRTVHNRGIGWFPGDPL